jgi:hypothetical protein
MYGSGVTHAATPAPDNRAEGRSNVFLTAVMDVGGNSTPVRIRNISGRGALVDGPALPPVGSEVRLVRGSLSAAGQLAWHGAGQAGINFERDIDVGRWVQRTAHGGQQRVDGMVAAVRSGSPAAAYLPDDGSGQSLPAISAELDRICERLASTSAMSVEFGEELLKLDAVAQLLRQAATGRSYQRPAHKRP